MKTIRWFAIIMIVVLLWSGFAPAINAQDTMTYTVQEGDTLSSIAARYSTTIAAIMEVNPEIDDPAEIDLGQEIQLPEEAQEPTLYTVQEGDTLTSIALEHDVTVGALHLATPDIVDPTEIFVGQEIWIPATVVDPTLYTVQEGDTLFSIAARYSTTVEAIMEVNPEIDDPAEIEVGQEIQLPEEAQEPTLYTVQEGDTLFSIADEHGITAEAIQAANPDIVDPAEVEAGQVIWVPAAVPEPVEPVELMTYTVEEGDTLSSIAVRHSTTVEAIQAVNPEIVDPTLIEEGQEIQLPAEAQEPILHTVQERSVVFDLPNDIREGDEAPWGDEAYIRLRSIDEEAYPTFDLVGRPFILTDGTDAVSMVSIIRAAVRANEADETTVIITLSDMGLEFGAIVGWEASLYAGAEPDEETSGRFTEWVTVDNDAVTFTLPDDVREDDEAPWGDEVYARVRSATDAYPSFDLVSDPFTLEDGDYAIVIEIDAINEPRDDEDAPAQETATVTVHLLDLGGEFGALGEWEASLYAGAEPDEETSGRFTQWMPVQEGDTLTSIALEYGVTVEAILGANPDIVEPTVLEVGQEVWIPAAVIEPPEPVEPPVDPMVYTVEENDTLFSIAIRYSTTVEAIQAVNPEIVDPTLIEVGQEIQLPEEAQEPLLYTVQEGDTLTSIALEYGVTADAIQAANPDIVDPTLIEVGQEIWIPAAVVELPEEPEEPEDLMPYTVQPGDTLSSIATRYSTTVGAIQAVNPEIVDPTLIEEGQEIQLPAEAQEPAVYTVVPGDTLTSIAAQHNSTVLTLLSANPDIVNPNVISVGQQIWIPEEIVEAPVAPPEEPIVYTVQPGDTLSGIAFRHGVTVNALLAANPDIVNPNMIFVGQQIQIPAVGQQMQTLTG